MFEVGFTEIVLILGLALLVLGPEKLPGLAQKVGRWTGRARAMARQLRTQLEHEVTLEELSRSKPMHTSSASTSTEQSTPPPTPETPTASSMEEIEVGAANDSGHGSYDPDSTKPKQ
jgi:sec-independent protein translocase protein TatB